MAATRERLDAKTHLEAIVIVHKPAEELFTYTVERLLAQEPVPGASSIEISEGPVGPGRKISTRSTRITRPAPESTSMRRYANLESSATTLFEPIRDGTRMKVSVKLWVSGVNTLWHPVMLLADGNTYKNQFHKSVDDMLDRVEGPSRGRKVVSFVRQHWSGWIVFAVVLLALLWAHASHAQLGISDAWLQVVRVVIGLMVVGALLGGYFMAIVRQSR